MAFLLTLFMNIAINTPDCYAVQMSYDRVNCKNSSISTISYKIVQMHKFSIVQILGAFSSLEHAVSYMDQNHLNKCST